MERPVRRGRAGLLVTSCIVGFQAFAASPEQAPVRVTTRLVEVHVIVEAANGEPADDLTREDFTLFDGGHQERISLFAVESPRAIGPSDEPLPPNTFSNRLEQFVGAASSITAILFDGLNTHIADQSYARQQIVTFLGELQPQDRVALYALGRGLHVLQDFTSDSDALVHALASYEGDLTAESEAALRDSLDPGLVQFRSWLGDLKLNLIDYYARDRALRTVRSLVAIANHLERLPGRKNLIWVSGSFPVWVGRDSVPLPVPPAGGQQQFWPEIERAARALNNSNLAIYPVDARGLMAPAGYSPERASFRETSPESHWSGIRTMEVLAERTGGQAFFNNNDLKRALRQAADDSRLMYALGYHPSHDTWDGKFREIKVRVNRPGLRLRHRRGYFAQPEEPRADWYRSGVLGAAMWSPVDATRLGLTVRVIPGPKRALDLELQLDAHDIALQPAAGHWEGKLDVWVVQLGPRDKLLDTTSHIADLRLNQPSFERVMRAGNLVLMERAKRANEAVLLRVLVRDVTTGALGSVSIPLERVVLNSSD